MVRIEVLIRVIKISDSFNQHFSDVLDSILEKRTRLFLPPAWHRHRSTLYSSAAFELHATHCICRYIHGYCRIDRDETGASGPRGGCARDFVKFRKKLCIARARRGRAGLKGPRPDLTMTGRCHFSSSVGSSKIKIRTSSRNKTNWALLRDEVRILISMIWVLCDVWSCDSGNHHTNF